MLQVFTRLKVLLCASLANLIDFLLLSFFSENDWDQSPIGDGDGVFAI
jgi:hypothetical protein